MASLAGRHAAAAHQRVINELMVVVTAGNCRLDLFLALPQDRAQATASRWPGADEAGGAHVELLMQRNLW